MSMNILDPPTYYLSSALHINRYFLWRRRGGETCPRSLFLQTIWKMLLHSPPVHKFSPASFLNPSQSVYQYMCHPRGSKLYSQNTSSLPCLSSFSAYLLLILYSVQPLSCPFFILYSLSPAHPLFCTASPLLILYSVQPLSC